MCCLKSDGLSFLIIFSANKVAILCSVDILCLSNCITETSQVTEGRMLASPDLRYLCKKITQYDGWNLENVQQESGHITM